MRGEAEAIVLSIEKSAYLVLLDDYEAREMAKKLELKVTGTVGVLLLAKEMDILPKKFNELLDELKNNGFWLSEELYNKVLQEAEKL